MGNWQVRDRFLEMNTRWFTLIGEHLTDDQGQPLEYWRVERADSVIVLTRQGEDWVLPPPIYRPGWGQTTLDFPGGRIAPEQSLATAARAIVGRELNVTEDAIATLHPINQVGWPVNSSFSSQQLYGMIATLHTDVALADNVQRFPSTVAGHTALATALTCLQCRALWREWQAQASEVSDRA